MPNLFIILGYKVYFWSNENDEPIHVHIAEGRPHQNATKVWITSAGKCIVVNNISNIPPVALRNIVRIIEARSDEVKQKWFEYFGEIRYFC